MVCERHADVVTTHLVWRSSDMIVREVFDNGLCLLTESMPDVRSVSLGVPGSLGDPATKDRSTRALRILPSTCFSRVRRSGPAQDIAQDVDSIGGQLDAFTAKECAGYYIKVLDDHLAGGRSTCFSDLLLHPAFPDVELEKEKQVILEEIKTVEDVPG